MKHTNSIKFHHFQLMRFKSDDMSTGNDIGWGLRNMVRPRRLSKSVQVEVVTISRIYFTVGSLYKIFSDLGRFLRLSCTVTSFFGISREKFDTWSKLAAAQVTASSYAFAAVRQDGTVVTWGDAACGGDSSCLSDDGMSWSVLWAPLVLWGQNLKRPKMPSIIHCFNLFQQFYHVIMFPPWSVTASSCRACLHGNATRTRGSGQHARIRSIWTCSHIIQFNPWNLMMAMLCHASPAYLPVPRCKQYGSSPTEAQSEISCKASERLQRLPKRLLRSEMMEVLLPGATRLEVNEVWDIACNIFFCGLRSSKESGSCLNMRISRNRLQRQKTEHVVE